MVGGYQQECDSESPIHQGPLRGTEKDFQTHRVDSFFKPNNMLCQLLCLPKDPAKKEEISGMIYQINLKESARMDTEG